MGWPVAHSRSPIIHNHWIRQHQLRGAYGLFPVEPHNLGDAIRGLKALGLAGCNLTIPHKVAAMSYMDWVQPLAQRMGAINTIVVQADGALHGFNNDGFGYLQSLRDAQPHWRADAGPIVVLGAGGAARVARSRPAKPNMPASARKLRAEKPDRPGRRISSTARKPVRISAARNSPTFSPNINAATGTTTKGVACKMAEAVDIGVSATASA